MKTKAKLTLAVSALSAVVLATAVTSTFAWFTTRTSAQVTSGSLLVKAPSSLTVKGRDYSYGVNDHSVKPASGTTNQLDFTGTTLGAVSSEYGKNFFAHNKLQAEYNTLDDGNSVVDVDNITGDGKNVYVGYMKYNLAVTAAAGEANKALKIDVTVAGATKTANWWRVGLYATDSVENDPDTYPAPTEGDHLAYDNDVKAPKVVFAGDGAAASENPYTSVDTKTASARALDKTRTITVNSGYFVTSATKEETIQLVLTTWIEGTADGNQNGAGGESINVTVDFSLVSAS